MDLRQQLYNWSNIAQRWLYPPTCLLCGAPGEGSRDLCDGCLHDLPWITNPCPICATPLPDGAAGPCGRCLNRPPPFARAVIPFRYAPPLDHLIRGFKYRERLVPGRVVGELAATAIAERVADRPHLIVPVPLHPRQLRRRGYNQALELARPLAGSLGVPLAPRLCRRLRETASQAGLSAKDRHRNVKGAFGVTGAVRGLRIALVDDVLSTGSTVGELTRVLLKAGADQVEVFACARASR